MKLKDLLRLFSSDEPIQIRDESEPKVTWVGIVSEVSEKYFDKIVDVVAPYYTQRFTLIQLI